MHKAKITGSVTRKALLILIWMHELQYFVFGSNGYRNYDIFGIKNDETMKSSILCINHSVYDCSDNSDLRINDSVLFPTTEPTYECDLLSMDINQDLFNGPKQCIDIFIKAKNAGKTGENQIGLKNQEAVKLLVPKNVIFENLLIINDISQSTLINETASVLKFHFIRNSGIHVGIELSELNLYPIYEDITYDGVNDVILNASPGTYAFRLKQPLMEIANQFCRYPLPNRYLLSLKAFRRRQTYGYKRTCGKHTQMNENLCRKDEYLNYPTDEKQKTHFYERSLNDQCGRNLRSLNLWFDEEPSQ
ncbi:unnamed protein product [Schistosoma turkestanicum]|nr:unnamed protein product [Schistosoma turkestanicum]